VRTDDDFENDPAARSPGARGSDAGDDLRERAAQARDALRAQVEGAAGSAPLTPAAERRQAALDRERAAVERRQAALEREEAARESEQAAKDRRQAFHDRHQATLDLRQQLIAAAGGDASLDEQTALDREQAMLDREQAALDREQTAINRDLAALDREQATLDRELASQLWERAVYDDQAPVLRRGVGLQRLAEELDRTRRTGGTLTAAVVEVEGAGDDDGSRLHAAGRALATGLRSYDVVLRLGPTAFACILLDVDEDDARRRLDEVTAALADDGGRVACGFAEPAPDDTADTLLDRAAPKGSDPFA
jgi:hypothetical protein